MNLQTQISTNLWLAIVETYEAQNYSHAIVDAVHFLSNILREKSGIDGDGAALVGAALGGNTPPLKLNNFQTDYEKNEQRGMESLLRGIYMGIRNPRSHDLIKDDKATADAIICFIDYLIRVLNLSRPPFTIQSFVDRIYEPHFVSNRRYADVLVEEIPVSKLLDTMIEIFRRKNEGSQRNLPYVFAAIRQRMSEEQLFSFINVVSDELLNSQNQQEIQVTLQMLDPKLWPKFREATRLRIENMIIASIARGRLDRNAMIRSGELGVLGTDYLHFFTLKSEAANALANTISKSPDSCRYILHLFGSLLPIICEDRTADTCIAAIAKMIDEGWTKYNDTEFLDIVDDMLGTYPEYWQKRILEATSLFHPVGIENTEIQDEDIPF